MDMRGQRVLVMGGSGVAGTAIVEAMLACGGDVVAAARRRTGLYDLRASMRHHERLHTAECDATDARGVEALFDSIEKKAPIDGVVHVAGVGSDHVLKAAVSRMSDRARGWFVLVGRGDAADAEGDRARRAAEGSPVRVHVIRTDTAEDCAVVAPAVVHLAAAFES